MPFFVRMGDLNVCAWFGIVRNFSVDVLLGTSVIDRCIWGIFHSKRSIVRWLSRPKVILSTQKKFRAIFADTEGVSVYTIATAVTDRGAKSVFCGRQIMIPAYSQAVVLVLFRCEGLMTIETHQNVFELRSFKIARDLLDILPGKLSYV